MALFYFYVCFFVCLLRTSWAYTISSKQNNFNITLRKGHYGAFGNKSITGNVGDCYPLEQHRIPSVISLSDESSQEYTFHGFSADRCDDNSVVTKLLKPNASIYLNDRKSICSFSLGKPPAYEAYIIFTHESRNLYTIDIKDTNCYNICNSDESSHYPNRLEIYEKNGSVANNFVRLYSEPDCFIEDIISHRNGSEEITKDDDLFELSLLDSFSIVKSFSLTTN